MLQLTFYPGLTLTGFRTTRPWSTSLWDEELESCPRSERSHKTVLNMTTKHNPVTLPINMCAMGTPDVQPLDLTKLGDHQSVKHMPQKEVTEFLYASNQIVCVKDDKGGSEITLVLVCLQENAKVGIKRWWPNFLFGIRLIQYVFRKVLRNRSRKRALFASWLPKSIMKMFWNFRRKSCFFFMLKFNRQVMTSLSPQNQQKFLLMNMRLCDIHQGDTTGVWLRLDDFLFYEWWSKTYENNRALKTEICWEFRGTLKNISGDQGNMQ